MRFRLFRPAAIDLPRWGTDGGNGLVCDSGHMPQTTDTIDYDAVHQILSSTGDLSLSELALLIAALQGEIQRRSLRESRD